MNSFSQAVSRFHRGWMLIAGDSVPLRGRLDVFRILWVRRKKLPRAYTIRLSHGKVFIDGQNAIIDLRVFAQIFVDQVYSDLHLTDRIVIDIGAHKGYFAAYALLRGAKAVLCYEPERSNFMALTHFIRTLGKNERAVEIHHEAVGEEGEVTLYLSEDSWAHTTVFRGKLTHTSRINVPSRSLATVLESAQRRFPGFDFLLKIDAEGAECPLLLQTPAALFSRVKEIVFEYHDFSSCSLDQILRRLRSMGYEYVASVREADLHHFRSKP
jgi:FkbM family methyltransferase